MRSANPIVRCHCKVIAGLVPGKSLSSLASVGLSLTSQESRAAHRLIAKGRRGMADKREDKGEYKVNKRDESES